MWNKAGYVLLVLAIGREAARHGFLGTSFQKSVATADIVQAAKSLRSLDPADQRQAAADAQLWSELTGNLEDEQSIRAVMEILWNTSSDSSSEARAPSSPSSLSAQGPVPRSGGFA